LIWDETGSPKFLMDLMKKNVEMYVNLKNLKIQRSLLDAASIDRLLVSSLLFQTGYLTIKEILYEDEPVYILDIPNNEVRKIFDMHILITFTEDSNIRADIAKTEIQKALQTGDLQIMLDMLRGLFASIPYNLQIRREAYYHSVFYAVMNVLGFDIDAEVSVSKGKVDAVLELSDKVYIIEFKYSDCEPKASPEEKRKLFDEILDKGMKQIKDRGYHKKYENSGKTVYQAVFAFLGKDEVEMRVELK